MAQVRAAFVSREEEQGQAPKLSAHAGLLAGARSLPLHLREAFWRKFLPAA